MLKVNSLMKREISQIVQQELKDPRIGFVTIIGVEVANDLRHAKVYCSVMGDKAKKDESMRGLKNAKGYIQSELGSRIRIRYIPELHFILDETLDYSMHIEEMLRKIHDEKPISLEENTIEDDQ